MLRELFFELALTAAALQQARHTILQPSVAEHELGYLAKALALVAQAERFIALALRR